MDHTSHTNHLTHRDKTEVNTSPTTPHSNKNENNCKNNHHIPSASGASNSPEVGHFETPGQYERDGVTFPGSLNPKSLDWLQDTFHFRSDDVLIISYPKSGSTWLQLMIHLILNKDEIHKTEISKTVERVAYFLEGMTRPGSTPNFTVIDQIQSPRIIKSHLQYRHLQKAIERGIPQILVMIRNPKDTLVSMFNFYRMFSVLGYFPGSWNDFFGLIMNDKVVYGSWFDHTKGWLQFKGHPKVEFVYFEDMKENPMMAVRQISKFCKQTLSEADLIKIVEITCFKNMKASPKTSMKDLPGFNNTISQFLRKGEVGDWKNYFTVAQNELFDALYAREMKDCDINIRFEM